MFQYSKIRIAGTWLTDTGLSSGTELISEITGLDKLKLNRQSAVFIAIDGTPYKQFHDNKGLPLSIRVPLLPTANLDTVVNAINTHDNGGTAIPLYITGPMGTFALNVVSSGIDTKGNALEAGIQDVTFGFVIASSDYVLTATYKGLTLTPQAVTLTAV